MCQADAQTAAIIKKLVATGSGDGVRVRYVKAVALYWGGGQAMFAWHNKTLKPQLKGNIWKEGLYVSHRERRARDTHRERWWINRGEKPSKRSSCLDLTSPDGLCKTAQDGEQCTSVCMCTCEREEHRIGRCDVHGAYKESLSPSHLTGWF